MDYQEAIKEAEAQFYMYESMILYNKDFEPKNDNNNYERKMDFLKTAISAMQELEKYRDAGLTLKQVAKMICELSATKRVLGHYQKLGALEEVREAVEKQKVVPAKEDGAFGECSRCGTAFNSELVDEYDIGYCPWCGQAVEFIDWSEEE